MQRVFLLLCLMMAGCIGGPPPLQRVEPGMSERQVLAILGRPDAVADRLTARYLRYDRIRGGGDDEGPWIVEFRGGHVHTTGVADEYGTLETLFPPAEGAVESP